MQPSRPASYSSGRKVAQRTKPEHVTLSNGEVLKFDRARQFMDYYCQRFNFDLPDVVYTPAGSQKWEAVMTVGGRKIGMGAGSSKTKAENRSYLDVVRYLEASDPPLWANFSRLKPATLTSSQGGAPHVVLTMSDDLEDEVRDLCKNIRGSELWSKSAKSVEDLNDTEMKLTPLGRILQQLHVEPSIGRIAVYGAFYRCLDSALTLAAILADRDPFLAPNAQKVRATAVKDSWSPPGYRSDPLAAVSAYNTWYTLQQTGRDAEARNFIDFNFIHSSTFESYHRVKEKIYTALVDAGVIAVSAGGIQTGRGAGSRSFSSMPASLNSNSDSLPLLAALIATSSAPNFALRLDPTTYRTRSLESCKIHSSSVNNYRRENLQSESTTIIHDKQIYAFTETSRFLSGQPLQLRATTRLDPMVYVLFGAFEVEPGREGLQCDGWLSIDGDIDALDDLHRLKTLLESYMFRVFEGIESGLGASSQEGTGSGDRVLSRVEIIELEDLTEGVVSILDRYYTQRGGSPRVPITSSVSPTPPQVAPSDHSSDETTSLSGSEISPPLPPPHSIVVVEPLAITRTTPIELQGSSSSTAETSAAPDPVLEEDEEVVVASPPSVVEPQPQPQTRPSLLTDLSALLSQFTIIIARTAQGSYGPPQ